MATTKVYGQIFSPAVRSVLLTANLIDHSVEFKEVNLFKGHHLRSAYLKLNPLHTIPTIEDDGFILYDSNAIVTYLVDKYAKDDYLYPKDLQIRAIVNQRLFFSIILFTALKDWSAPFRPGNDGIMRQESYEQLQSQLDNFEVLLRDDSLWVAGTKLPTVADICLLCTMDTAEIFLEHEIESRTKIRAWLQRMQSWAKANIRMYSEIAKDSKKAILSSFSTRTKSRL